MTVTAGQPITAYTAERLIEYAYQDAKLLQSGDRLNSDQVQQGLLRLNDVIMTLSIKGLKLFLLQLLPVTLTAGKATYVFGPTGDVVVDRPYNVLEGYYITSTGNSTPLNVLAWTDYLQLSQRTSQGAVNSYFVDKQATQLSVSLWNVPDSNAATGSCQFLVRTKAPLVVNLSNSTAFPPEWFMALRWSLARDICIGQPMEIVQIIEGRAAEFVKLLEDQDVEDAPVMFAPDPRGDYSNRKFR